MQNGTIRVIVLGADHHNTLAAIRAFGKDNYDCALILHGVDSTFKRIKVIKSKYIDRRNVVFTDNSEETIVNAIMKLRSEEKSILFPTSDLSAITIDKYQNTLKKYFLFPSFCDSEVTIVKLMDKWEQYQLSKELEIPTPKTKLINTDNYIVDSECAFPCIVKPRISAFGSKADISICYNSIELQTAIRKYMEEGYCSAIIQEYIEKQYETDTFGFLLPEGNFLDKPQGGMIYKLREELENATTFGVFILDISEIDLLYNENIACKDKRVKMSPNEYDQLRTVNQKLIQYLSKHRYNGFFDIEYIVAQGIVYLIEINFRQSGNAYAQINHDHSVQTLWAKGLIEKATKPIYHASIGSYLMMETADLPNIKNKTISISEWIRDIRNTTYFAVFSKEDLLASLRILWQCMNGILTRNAKEVIKHVFCKRENNK